MSRRCPFDHCGQLIPEDRFACLRHWNRLRGPQKAEIWSAYNAYLLEEITLDELRARQQVVLDQVQGRVKLAPPPVGTIYCECRQKDCPHCYRQELS